MPFDPDFPPPNALLVSDEFRAQFQALKDLIDNPPARPLDAVPAGPLLLIQRKIGTVQTLFQEVALDPVGFDAATFAPLGSGGTFDGGTFTAVATGVFRFSYRLIFDNQAFSGPAGVTCLGAGTAPGVGGLLFAGLVNGAAIGAGFGLRVISFSETIALASGETYRLTARQDSVAQLNITGGEVVIERLG